MTVHIIQQDTHKAYNHKTLQHQKCEHIKEVIRSRKSKDRYYNGKS
jgi:hypothetical protein